MPTRTSAIVWSVGAVLTVLVAGCGSLSPLPTGTVSLGHTSGGALVRGHRLPDRGRGFVRARPGEPTRFGTQAMIDAIERAAAQVDRTFPGTVPIKVGDVSSPLGGRHHRHRSHRTGRDVDVIFYLRDALGRSVDGKGWLAIDRFGAARDADGQVYFFDEARNWQFVRALMTDPVAPVQWIFCSRGVKARLLRYAAVHEKDPDVLFRAAWVLHQPSKGRPHDDHFHVRISCNAEERANGCIDPGPFWPWMRDLEKGIAPAQSVEDERLIGWLMAPLP